MSFRGGLAFPVLRNMGGRRSTEPLAGEALEEPSEAHRVSRPLQYLALASLRAFLKGFAFEVARQWEDVIPVAEDPA
jgi:hypothetical protein